MGPFTTTIPYGHEHYPERWSFHPAHDSTLLLIQQRHGIGTLITPAPWLWEKVTADGIRRAGLVQVGSFPHDDTEYLVFRAPEAPLARPAGSEPSEEPHAVATAGIRPLTNAPEEGAPPRRNAPAGRRAPRTAR